jgi:hypothetical protein
VTIGGVALFFLTFEDHSAMSATADHGTSLHSAWHLEEKLLIHSVCLIVVVKWFCVVSFPQPTYSTAFTAIILTFNTKFLLIVLSVNSGSIYLQPSKSLKTFIYPHQEFTGAHSFASATSKMAGRSRSTGPETASTISSKGGSQAAATGTTRMKNLNRFVTQRLVICC